MRKISSLIKEAKQNTNTTDVESISDDLCVSLLNRSQEFIQAFLFTQNIESKIFRKEYTFITTAGTNSYALPSDIYAKNSINTIMYKNGNTYSPLRQIAEKARGTTSGYFLSDSNIILSQMPTYAVEFSVSYTRRLPRIGIQYGKIESVQDNVKLVLEAGYLDLVDADDFYCVVDVYGNIVRSALVVDQSGEELYLTDTSSILAGMYVVPGLYVTTICELPDELESAMIMSLETMINARMSSSDLKVAKPFSDEMLTQIGSMFAENTTDIFMPPIVEYSEWV